MYITCDRILTFPFVISKPQKFILIGTIKEKLIFGLSDVIVTILLIRLRDLFLTYSLRD